MYNKELHTNLMKTNQQKPKEKPKETEKKKKSVAPLPPSVPTSPTKKSRAPPPPVTPLTNGVNHVEIGAGLSEERRRQIEKMSTPKSVMTHDENAYYERVSHVFMFTIHTASSSKYHSFIVHALISFYYKHYDLI